MLTSLFFKVGPMYVKLKKILMLILSYKIGLSMTELKVAVEKNIQYLQEKIYYGILKEKIILLTKFCQL